MRRYRWLRWIALASFILLPLLTAGCGLFKSDDTAEQIDPPQNEADAAAAMNAAVVDGVMETENQAQVTLYFKDEKGFVAPISMEIPKVEGIAKEALSYMVEGGPAESSLPSGFTALIPNGTQIKGMNIIEDKKLAIIDFSEEFASYNVQDERKILEAITWTLTGFPSIENVEIWVEGKALKEMPVDATPLDEPLSRAMGINIERSEGVNLGQSSPVTLYFLNQTTAAYQYFVPVTRMIPRTDDIATATMEELIKGPDQISALSEVMVPTAEILNVERSEDLVTVNLSDKILNADQKAPADALKAVILSLTESTGASKVQIMVNGNTKVSSTDDGNYNVPVNRPAAVNPLKS